MLILPHDVKRMCFIISLLVTCQNIKMGRTAWVRPNLTVFGTREILYPSTNNKEVALLHLFHDWLSLDLGGGAYMWPPIDFNQHAHHTDGQSFSCLVCRTSNRLTFLSDQKMFRHRC